MNAESKRPACPESDLAAAQDRIEQLEEQLCEAEDELEAAEQIISDQDVRIECLRIQLEAADLEIEEAAAARRKLEQQIADVEDNLVDEPCPLAMPKALKQPRYPPGYRPNPLVEAMIAQHRPKE